MSVLTVEEKKYFDQIFAEIKDRISDLEKNMSNQMSSFKELFNSSLLSIKESVSIQLEPIIQNQKDYRDNFHEIYKRLAKVESDVNKIDTLQDRLEGDAENKSSWKSNLLSAIISGIVVGVIVYIVTAL